MTRRSDLFNELVFDAATAAEQGRPFSETRACQLVGRSELFWRNRAQAEQVARVFADVHSYCSLDWQGDSEQAEAIVGMLEAAGVYGKGSE